MALEDHSAAPLTHRTPWIWLLQHSASRCVNGTSRYCWVCSYHDDRVQAMPHKMYQDCFNAEFLEKLDPGLKPIVDWLPGYVEAYGDQVLGRGKCITTAAKPKTMRLAPTSTTGTATHISVK